MTWLTAAGTKGAGIIITIDDAEATTLGVALGGVAGLSGLHGQVQPYRGVT
jgi:hypothetical protein